MSIQGMGVRSAVLGFTKFLTQFTVLITVPFFVISHLSANHYYSTFGIDYFNYTDTGTAFSFGLESFGRVFTYSLLIVLTLAAIYTVIMLPLKGDKSNNGLILSQLISIMKGAGLGIYVLFLLFFCGILFNLLKPYIDGVDTKSELVKRLYIPVKVEISSTGGNLYCVKSLGSLGAYQVFVTPGLKPILMAKSQILSIEPMFAPAPIEFFSRGYSVISNPLFDAEYKVWIEHWDKECSKVDTGFITFDFVRSYTRHLDADALKKAN